MGSIFIYYQRERGRLIIAVQKLQLGSLCAKGGGIVAGFYGISICLFMQLKYYSYIIISIINAYSCSLNIEAADG